MAKTEAQQQAIFNAITTLKQESLNTIRLSNLGLNPPINNVLSLSIFNQTVSLQLSNFQCVNKENNKPTSLNDTILLLHYLLCDLPIHETNKLISFRDIPGGQFYWTPFLSRSIKPLVKVIGNDISFLKKNLNRFSWTACDYGDFSVKIHVIGKIWATLIYRLGDDEFSPTADLLFDSCIRNVYCAEDVAAIASRICFGLL